MKRLEKIYPLVLLLSLCLSLFWKTDINSPSVLSHKIQPFFEDQSLRLVKSVRPVNRGDFQIEFYRPPTCPGFIALIQLNKNEEGAAILAHYLKQPLDSISFIHNAQVFDHFPAFQYWLNTVFRKNATHVIAIKEFGSCQLIENIDWSLI